MYLRKTHVIPLKYSYTNLNAIKIYVTVYHCSGFLTAENYFRWGWQLCQLLKLPNTSCYKYFVLVACTFAKI